MGVQEVRAADHREIGEFTRALLRDVQALAQMLDEGKIESGVRRIGAEQEVFLVDKSWHPAPVAIELLEAIDDPDFTTELARFNLEFNLAPLEFGGDCLSRLQSDVEKHLGKLRKAAQALGVEVVLTGILPTLSKSDLGLENMSPRPRYLALNNALNKLRGDDYEFRIEGVDDLIVKHDSVMLESCNTSFQIHFQVGCEEFARLYNIAQLVTAPVLAAAANSPLLFGKRLWRETRIALFQQSIDTRKATTSLRESHARVRFGSRWVENSVLEIYREDITRFRVLIGLKSDEDPIQELAEGRTPRLEALCVHNSTVYRWNRPCYGIMNGRPHLRIENRVIPSGPTVIDSVANAAFFFGLMAGVSDRFEEVSSRLDFAHVRDNFLAAARSGLGAQFSWIDGKRYPAQELICEHLIPMARQGLLNRKAEPKDIDRYLGVLERRVESGKTGAQWMLDSLSSLKDQGLKAERLAALTAATAARQDEGRPVHEWTPARLAEGGGWKSNYQRVEQFMTTDLFTVHAEDTIDLVANMMDWEGIRHILVEDEEQILIGLLSYRSVLRHLAKLLTSSQGDVLVSVKEIMVENPVTVAPDTSTHRAIKIMRKHRFSCLPVVREGRLIGVVTERDFMNIARDLLEESLQEQLPDQET